MKKFPCLALAIEACKAAKTFPAVLNAANEVAVQAFLGHQIGYTRMSEITQKVMHQHKPVSSLTLADILSADAWARRIAKEQI